MGLFGGNYSKAGPGVSKNAPEKNRFFFFFEMLGRKFFKLIPLNLMYLVTLLPLIGGVFLSIKLNPALFTDGVLNNAFGSVPLFVFTGDIVGLILLGISIFITGPATCGMTYVLRNMQRQEHTWIFSDFREHFAKNFKQGVIMSIIDLVIPALLYIAYVFYTYDMALMMPGSAAIALVAKYAIIIFAALFIIMHYYIYVMIVTFDMKLKDILKNAMLFSFAKLPLNIFISIIVFAVIILSLWYLIFGVIFALVITLSLLGFFIIYSIYPTIDSSMISAQSSKSDDEDERDFEDVV